MQAEISKLLLLNSLPGKGMCSVLLDVFIVKLCENTVALTSDCLGASVAMGMLKINKVDSSK